MPNHVIFGPGGPFHKSGNTTFVGHKQYHRQGRVTHGPNGAIQHMGSTDYLPGGGMVQRMGNVFYAPNGAQYHLMGSVLHGPGGKMWHNVSAADVAMIIDSDS